MLADRCISTCDAYGSAAETSCTPTNLGWLVSLGWHESHSKLRPLVATIKYIAAQGAHSCVLPRGLVPHRPQLSLAVVVGSCVNTAQPTRRSRAHSEAQCRIAFTASVIDCAFWNAEMRTKRISLGPECACKDQGRALARVAQQRHLVCVI